MVSAILQWLDEERYLTHPNSKTCCKVVFYSFIDFDFVGFVCLCDEVGHAG